MILNKSDYWEKLVDYYYDNVHWDEDPCPTIFQWLERDFNAHANLYSTHIQFDDESHCSWFLLRWA